MDKDWSIRGYNDGDEYEINELFNSIFNKKRTLEHWNWEFKKNPDGFKVLVAVDNERIIGHLGALHRKIRIGQEKALASLEVDGMTRPDYGHRGIFIALGKRLLSESEKDGFGILIGFPNENALPGHRKLNCIELFTPPVMVRPLNFRNISKKLFANRFLGFLSGAFGRFLFRVVYRVKKAKIEENVTIKRISKFDERFDRFWENACSAHSIILHRDSRYLNWRYAERPERLYEIFIAERDERVLAMAVVRVLEMFGLRNGAIVDILALPNQENTAHSVLLKAMEHLEEEGVDLIACLIPKWSIYYKVLRRCGFVTCPKGLNPKEEPFIIYPISKGFNSNFVKNPNNWFITWGDSDVV